MLVLRLGAVLNALRAAHRWYLAVKDSPGPAGQSDRIHAFLFAVALLSEAGKLVSANQGSVCELARGAEVDEDLIQSMLRICDPKGQLQKTILKPIRDKKVFHWDPQPYWDWINGQRDERIILFRGQGPKRGETVAAASLEATTSEPVRQAVPEVVKATKVLTNVLELALRHFLRGHGAQLVEDKREAQDT